MQEIREIRIAGYLVDITKMETHSLEAEVTDHPVEKGSTISDHVRLNPIEITLECLISDTPIGITAQDPSRRLGDIEIEGESADTLPTPSEDAYAFLKRIRLAREPVTIETSLDRFENMVLTRLTVPRNAQTSGGLTFEVTFKEVVIVENLRVTVRVATPGSGSLNKKDLGLSPAKPVIETATGKKILWRHGLPPGTSQDTIPVGVITFSETIILKQVETFGTNEDVNNGATPEKYAHESNGNFLSTQELVDFNKDLKRDYALQKKLLETKQKMPRGSNRLDKAKDLIENRRKHPGAIVDPAFFGF